MNRQVPLSRHLRLVVAAILATPVTITLAASPASPAQAALDGVTPFEIDSNTTVQTGTDWVSKFAAGQVAVSNDANFTGDAIVQTDVGSSTTAPSWLANCPGSNTDTVFKNSTNIDDPDWTTDHETQSVTPKDDICQSYFSFDVVEGGDRSGHIVAYVAFTRRVFNGDGSYYFVLSKGPNPDIRVAGDIVIEVDYGSQGEAQSIKVATWQGPGPTLSAFSTLSLNDPNVDVSPVQYFAELAIDLTALGLAPNVDDISTPEECNAFGFGRVISRTGNSPSATLKDDGEPTQLDFNVCGSLIVQKELTTAVPGTHEFPVVVTPPDGVTMDGEIVLEVPGDPSFTFEGLPPSDEGYNVWEELTGDLAIQWDLVSIVCENDNATPDDPDDDPDPIVITSEDDTFPLDRFETVTCTVTNSPAPAVINVDKDADGGDGTWPVDLTGTASGSVNVTDDDIIDFTTAGSFETFDDLAAGSYTLTEGDEIGGGAFRPSGWSCTVVVGGTGTTTSTGATIGLSLDPGDVVNCTITNTPVAPPNVRVEKSAVPGSFPETATAPGNPIVYTVAVHNDGTEPFTITNLTDAVEGGAPFDLDAAVAGDNAGLAGATIVTNNCGGLIGDSVAGGGSTSCQFSVSYTGRNAGDQIDDVATAFVVDEFGRTDSDDDAAAVTVTDVPPVITVDKQNVQPTTLIAPGGSATYTITITNGPNAIEPITITAVTDTLSSTNPAFGPAAINYFTVGGAVTATNCVNFVGTVLAIGASVSCQFTIDTTVVDPLNEGDTLTNTVAATAVDNDGTQVSDSDDASRPVLGELPSLNVEKTDNGAVIDEPGENIGYVLTISNLSITEPLTITSITDEVFFIPEGGSQVSRGSLVIDDTGVDASGLVGVTLVDTDCDDVIGDVLAVSGAPGDETSCTITLTLNGNAGDAYHDVVTVTGEDDEGTPAPPAQNEADTPVVNVQPAIMIVKDVTPLQVPETGGAVTYTLTITNQSVSSDPLTITSLSDSVFGSFFPVDTTTGIDGTNCFDLEGDVLAPGASTSCTITATLSGQAGGSHNNTASVTGVDDEGNSVSDNDDAVVLFTDVTPAIIVTKTANDTSVPESGQLVTFTVTVENNTLEPVVTTGLVDAVNGGAAIDLVGLQGSTCVDGQALAADDGVDGSGPDFYTCTFTRFVAQVGAELSHHDIVTVTAEDNEGNEAIDDDDATVTFELIPPTVTVTKTDNDATVNEPGGSVTYHLTIVNTSFEAVTITTLTDTITYTDPPQVIGPFSVLTTGPQVSQTTCAAGTPLAANDGVAGSGPDQTTCSFTVTLSGTAQIVSDVVNVIVVDNDAQQGTDDDDELTPIVDVLPLVQIVKTADPLAIDVGEEVTYTFVITNLSSVEELTLTELTDDRFGDIFDECFPEGADIVLAANNGQPGGEDETTCTITRTLDQDPGTAHTNVVTVTGEDDEGNSATDDDNATVLILAPDASVTKTVTSATRDGSGLWTIVYDVVVNNSGDGVAVLDVNDALHFGGGVTVNSVVAASPTPGVTLNALFNGTTDTLIAPDVTVLSNTSRTFTVTVAARIDAPVPGQGACDPEGTENGGFLNTVTLRSARTGDVIDSAFACAPFSTLTLVKNLVNNSGGTGTLADFVLTAAANGVTHVQGTGTVTAAVPAGTYTLAETTKAGYASSGFSCSTGQTGSSVTVPVASAVTCTITNDDAPVADLAIVKSASVPQIGAGGGFTWLLDVTNNGPDPAVGVVINDIVPGQVTVTGVTSAQFSCSNSGNTVTCTKASMAVGETGAISIAVTVPASAASGTVTNIGTVTATTPDNNPANNSDDASVTVVAQAPPPPTPPPVILPPTGSSSTTPVTWAAISLVLIGGMVMLVSRRRRDHTSVD